ncbi:MAG TPA: hypothetical protein VK285_00600 [Gaiellaceae bacterium]|nr:hypothetical protein [Gaiellaceae bacterium]
MSVEEELNKEVGTLSSGSGGQFLGPRAGTIGPTRSDDPQTKIAALEADVRQLLRGLQLLSRKIDDLAK